MTTDTKLEIPDAETRARITRHHNDGASMYRARHSTDNPPVPMVPLPQHVRTELIPTVPREVGTETLRIGVGQRRVLVPLGPRPRPVVEEVPAAAVSAPPIEPVAPVTEQLLKRILRALGRKP